MLSVGDATGFLLQRGQGGGKELLLLSFCSDRCYSHIVPDPSWTQWRRKNLQRKKASQNTLLSFSVCYKNTPSGASGLSLDTHMRSQGKGRIRQDGCY